MAISKVRKACYSNNTFAVVQALSKTFLYSDMTDNTNATGYIDFSADSLPANAFILGWKAKTITGFTGDTTAVIQVGIAGALGKYSTSTTGSVLAAGTVGTNCPEAAVYQAAAATPRVTITGGLDFTSISAGKTTVTIYYIAVA